MDGLRSKGTRLVPEARFVIPLRRTHACSPVARSGSTSAHRRPGLGPTGRGWGEQGWVEADTRFPSDHTLTRPRHSGGKLRAPNADARSWPWGVIQRASVWSACGLRPLCLPADHAKEMVACGASACRSNPRRWGGWVSPNNPGGPVGPALVRGREWRKVPHPANKIRICGKHWQVGRGPGQRTDGDPAGSRLPQDLGKKVQEGEWIGLSALRASTPAGKTRPGITQIT